MKLTLILLAVLFVATTQADWVADTIQFSLGSSYGHELGYLQAA